MIPSLVFTALHDINRRFLVVFEHTTAPNIISFVGVLVHIVSCYTFILKLELGLEGCGYATIVTSFFIWFSIHIYSGTVKGNLAKAWFLPGKSSLTAWKPYLELGFAGWALVFLELLVFDIMSLMSGWISVAHLSAMSVLSTIYSTLFALPNGLNAALCTRVGMSVG
jgi:Na+-driven multidrug efflux pump